MATRKVCTIVHGYTTSSPNLNYLEQLAKYLIQNGYFIRTNAISGTNSPIVKLEQSLVYLPSQEYLGLENKLPAPNDSVIKWATELAIEYFPRFQQLSDENKARVLANIYTLKGYNTVQTEFVLYAPAGTPHKRDRIDYNFPISLANSLGIKTLSSNEFKPTKGN